jgi:hypothetical protein
VNSQFVQIALPTMITLIVVVIAQILTQNRSVELLGKRMEDIRDVLRAEMKAETAVLHGEMAKNHSELLAKMATMEDRLDRRIEKLETGKWKA